MLPVMIVALLALSLVHASTDERPHLRERRFASISIYLCGSGYSSQPCGPCVYNCYPAQPQQQQPAQYQPAYVQPAYVQPAYVQPVIYQPPVVIQSPTVVQPQFVQPQSTQQCIGPCVNGQCPAGYTCNANNVCCATVAGK